MEPAKFTEILKIYIDVKHKDLLLYQFDQLVRRYPILELKEGLPIGKFSIDEKSFTPGGRLGSRWLGLNKSAIGIHGAPPEGADHLCQGVCLASENLEELYSLVPVGTVVEISKSAPEIKSPAVMNQFGPFPATPLAFPVVAGPHSYIVQRGDTIWKLSRRFKISMDSILAANLLPDPNRLTPGQVIYLPLPWPQKA